MVIDSRPSRDGLSIRRRRECCGCGHRFTTYEEIERIELKVLKRDGRHEIFDRRKLMLSFEKACEKRPVSLEAMEQAAAEILHILEQDDRREIPSKEIGLHVMEMLHKLDPIAYVRYASVYREFKAVDDFIEEIQILERKQSPGANQPELFNAT